MMKFGALFASLSRLSQYITGVLALQERLVGATIAVNHSRSNISSWGDANVGKQHLVSAGKNELYRAAVVGEEGSKHVYKAVIKDVENIHFNQNNETNEKKAAICDF